MPIRTYRHVIKCFDRARNKFLARPYSDTCVGFFSRLFWLAGLPLEENVRLTEARVRLAQKRIGTREREFFIEERREKQRKLSQHYRRLGMVFDTWLGASSTLTRYFGYEQLLEPQKPDEYLYKLAMDHVESGYPELDKLFNELRALRDKNKQEASSLEKTIEIELTDSMKTFPDLSPFQPTSQVHFYRVDRVLNAIKGSEQPQLRIVSTSSILDSREKDFASIMHSLRSAEGSNSLVNFGEEIARGNESTLARLKSEIGRLRMSHKDDFNRLEANIKQGNILANAIHNQVSLISSEIEDLEHLRGVCDYEKNLG
jgi:hypothetical protein